MPAGSAETAIDLSEGDLRDRIDRLGLAGNVADLERDGYTIVAHAEPLGFFDRLRAAVLALIEEQETDGAAPIALAGTNRSAWLLPRRGRIFEELHCNPKLVTLNEHMLGKGFQIYSSSGTMKTAADPALQFHTDYTAIRPPYPVHCQIVTALWTCDDWTEANGCTRLVPGSFRERRPPGPGEADDRAIPIECPKGSVIVWDGATWHGACRRTLPGIRIGVHSVHSRMAVRPLELYDDLPDEVVERNPPIFARMIGRDDMFSKTRFNGPDLKALLRMMQWINT